MSKNVFRKLSPNLLFSLFYKVFLTFSKNLFQDEKKVFSEKKGFSEKKLFYFFESAHVKKNKMNVFLSTLEISRKLLILCMVGFIYTFWYSFSSASSILEQRFQSTHHLQMTSSEGFQQHFSIISKFSVTFFELPLHKIDFFGDKRVP